MANQSDTDQWKKTFNPETLNMHYRLFINRLIDKYQWEYTERFASRHRMATDKEIDDWLKRRIKQEMADNHLSEIIFGFMHMAVRSVIDKLREAETENRYTADNGTGHK